MANIHGAARTAAVVLGAFGLVAVGTGVGFYWAAELASALAGDQTDGDVAGPLRTLAGTFEDFGGYILAVGLLVIVLAAAAGWFAHRRSPQPSV